MKTIVNEILSIINEEDKVVAGAVSNAISNISRFIDKVIKTLDNSGRLIYIGSGTSGRLGVLDASECPPTFGVSEDLVIGLMAGGDIALKKSIEGAEDDSQASVEQLNNINC